MKTIIAPTDFTASSLNACQYAALLAQKLNCKLVLFNVYEGAFYHSNVGLYGYYYLPVVNTNNQKMDKFTAILKKQFPKIEIEPFLTMTNFKTEMETFISKHQVQCAVLGLETKSRFQKFMSGSHGMDIAGKIDTPVIIVPQSYKTHKLSKILLAVDNYDKLTQTSLIDFGDFVDKAEAKLNLVHIKTVDAFYTKPLVANVKIAGKNRDVEFIAARDILAGVKKAISLSHADLIAIISQKHSMFYNLFTESTTKKIAYSTKIPVMAIHE